ncbi:winged helix-turn-helix domain-containing protein [Gordonia sp. PDNC005]|uniref:BTAD domain-containing putative transcriptional regulator n=1 Tax=Gordonia sp. PDNC005 TaxID=2811424 RepID=UPI0019663E87|nr:BTAD domain-containing putative transcriptional regulator [Gordonia sp. PDNC005]QRY61009.1 winged helix-turn-helix domain-containing protein [Gordonia sp. PDNC005]
MSSDSREPLVPPVIGLLGPVTVDGRAVPGVRARRLLVALVLAGGRPVSSAALIDDVWGDDRPKSAQAALHTQISRLRPLVGDADLAGSDGSYRLTGLATDLESVERLLTRGDPEAAVRLWRGIPGADLGTDDGPAERLRVEADRLRIHLDDARAHSAFASGDYATASDIARARMADDRLDESAHVLLMRALAADGRKNEALAVYAALRRTLAEELGADPGAEATALNAALVAGRPQTRATRRSPRLRPEPLIGRAEDLASLHDLIARHRVVTVLGPGGVGKTSIASAMGDDLSDSGASVFYVPLAAVRDDDDLIGVVASALGVGESDVRTSSVPRLHLRDLTDSLGDALRAVDAVLVLDNCEQVIDACAVLVQGLITALPALRVVVTSRSPLLIAAEQVYRLPVLDTEGAASAGVELFTARALSVRPDAELDPVAVAALCAHLDGVPLAIELAAARTRVMSVGEISDGLVERFGLLRSADRTAPHRHRTLEAVIDWSWDLLDDDARVALRRTCLFPDGFSNAAAAVVVGVSGAVLADALTALVDQSLLQVDESGGRTRFRMLEMVREFGERRASEAGEVAETTARMGQWAREMCRDVRGRYDQSPDSVLAAEVDVESENLVWVLRRAVAAGNAPAVDVVVAVFPVIAAFWASRGLHQEVGAWGVRVIDALGTPPTDPDDDTRTAWQLTLLIGAVHLLPHRDLRRVATAAYRLRRLHRPERTYDDVVEFLVAVSLARRPLKAYRTVLRGLEPHRPDRVRWVALTIRFNVRENAGDLDGALADSGEVAALAERPDSFAAAMTDMTTASVIGQQGRWAQALTLYERAVDRLNKLGAVDDARQVDGYIIAMLLSLGELDRARVAIDELSDGWKPNDPTPQGNPETVALMMIVMAEYQRLAATEPVGAIVGLLQRAADLLLGQSDDTSRDPGLMGCVTATVAARIRLGTTEGVDESLLALADAVLSMRDHAGWVDVPHSAGVAFVSGVRRCLQAPGDPAGARWMALGLRLRPRHDYPAVHELIEDAESLSGCSGAEWEAVVADTAALSRKKALDELHEQFAERRSAAAT